MKRIVNFLSISLCCLALTACGRQMETQKSLPVVSKKEIPQPTTFPSPTEVVQISGTSSGILLEAVNAKDEQVCDKIPKEEDKKLCVKNVDIVKKSERMSVPSCDHLEDKTAKNACIMHVLEEEAVDKKTSEGCNVLETPELKQQCINESQMSMAMKYKDVAYCTDKMTKEFREGCLQLVKERQKTGNWD